MMMYRLVNGVQTPLSSEEELEFIKREKEHKDYLNSLEYKQKDAVSKRVYPSIPDQLDMMYKDQMNNTTIWKDTITAIKLANPKPVE